MYGPWVAITAIKVFPIMAEIWSFRLLQCVKFHHGVWETWLHLLCRIDYGTDVNSIITFQKLENQTVILEQPSTTDSPAYTPGITVHGLPQ